MIRNIQATRKALTLRNDAINLFSIDSISLLIGENGSGKTSMLQEIAHAFVPHRRSHSLEEPCKIILESERPATIEQLSMWGVVYYTPAQNRPNLRSAKNFINASNRPVKNLSNLDRYSGILEGFGLNIELTATLKAEHRKIARLLAEALVKNRQFRTSSIIESFDFEALDERKQKLDKLSEFESSQSEFDLAEARYSEAFQNLSNLLQFKLRDSASNRRVFACMAVVTHFTERRRVNISLIIGMMTRFLELDFLPLLREDPRESEMREIAEFTDVYMGDMHFQALQSSKNVEIYSRILTSSNERADLEMLPVFKICRLGYPHISSGQWAIMQQVIALYESLKVLRQRGLLSLLVLVDEGDAFLHLEWQRLYLYQLDAFLNQCKIELGVECLQLVLASHSPLLATDVPRDFVTRFDSESTHPTFGAPMQLILNRSFGSRSMGEFAMQEINKTLHNAAQGYQTERDRYVYSIIEDPIITREIDYLLGQRDENVD
ncbi:hypothetical protein [Pseudomonas syringae group sp. J309-1]|uniref:hypothetical protein n=1 Tax=Pseudomonas syringae group sp. J309-1 TaxID=3079588 RepID=UPI00290F1F28|nr:hypothetical protein [Pseudomonas syringae group sp. J309-1]MDU8362440.1 hypothetical protein [Pseudomonas syringae group sp. J309-1]